MVPATMLIHDGVECSN